MKKKLVSHKQRLRYHARHKQKIGVAAIEFVKRAALAGLDSDADLHYIVGKAKEFVWNELTDRKTVVRKEEEEEEEEEEERGMANVGKEKKRGRNHAVIEE